MHITNPDVLIGKLEIPDFPFNPENVTSFETRQKLGFTINHQKLLTIQLPDLKNNEPDRVVVVNF